MSIQDGTLEFTLQKKDLAYKKDGGTVTTRSIILKEPGMDHVKWYLKLKQMITRASMEFATKAGVLEDMKNAVGELVQNIDKQDKKIEDEAQGVAESIAMMLLSSDKIEMGDFISTFEKMACHRGRSAVCLIDGQVSMTTPLWEALHPDDSFNMAVQWCAFFAMPSDEGGKITSDRPSGSPTERMEV